MISAEKKIPINKKSIKIDRASKTHSVCANQTEKKIKESTKPSTKKDEKEKKDKEEKVKANPDVSKYICGLCSATGVKLWRYCSSSDVDLHCGPCALKETKKEHLIINADGEHLSEPGSGHGQGTLTWEIGNYIPAILYRGTSSYWGISAGIIDEDYTWWRALPLSV